jgi:hypothetical protein
MLGFFHLLDLYFFIFCYFIFVTYYRHLPAASHNFFNASVSGNILVPLWLLYVRSHGPQQKFGAGDAKHRGRYSLIFTKFMIKNSANFLIVPQLGVLPLACALTWQDIPDNSQACNFTNFLPIRNILLKYLTSELLTLVTKF